MRGATNLVCLTDQVLTFRCFFSNFALLKVLADLDSPLDMCSKANLNDKCGKIATISNILDILEGPLHIVREIIEFRRLCEQWLSRLCRQLLRRAHHRSSGSKTVQAIPTVRSAANKASS